ncbi:MAG: hemerythrin domain-containing protein [Thermoplasmata archaeon]|nr:hemerythrin domain-containing protein [Candidatus Sysuiplasma jiujiangense]MBX8641339.1 hemerythrin domain-containing protein [Candidatus Sysuiplasma jiujiangense]
MLMEIATVEHGEITDELSKFIGSIKENSVDEEKFLRFRKRLKNHMFAEEEVLFPAVVDAEHIRIARGLEYEHAAIWLLAHRIASGLHRSDVGYVLKKAQSVTRLISFHIRREEETIYGFLEDNIEDDDAVDLIARMKSDTVPEDWVCRYLRDNSRSPDEMIR